MCKQDRAQSTNGTQFDTGSGQLLRMHLSKGSAPSNCLAQSQDTPHLSPTTSNAGPVDEIATPTPNRGPTDLIARIADLALVAENAMGQRPYDQYLQDPHLQEISDPNIEDETTVTAIMSSFVAGLIGSVPIGRLSSGKLQLRLLRSYAAPEKVVTWIRCTLCMDAPITRRLTS